MAAQAVRDLKAAHDELTNYLREADFASDYATLLLAAPSPSGLVSKATTDPASFNVPLHVSSAGLREGYSVHALARGVGRAAHD